MLFSYDWHIFCGNFSRTDIELQSLIRKSAIKEAGLLHNIASAEIEQQITQAVLSIAKRNEVIMREETGLAASVEDKEIARYTKEVLKEVMKNKARK
jgi:hypothetical protein